MAKRPFAAFDIDGTVIRWQLYHALADEFVRMGIIDKGAFVKVREARMTWKRRADSDSFLAYEHELVVLVDNALPGTRLNDFEAACDAVMAEYKDQVYTYTRELISDLKAQGYLLFAISASQAHIVSRFAAYYGFDDYGGSEYEVIDGVFTGRKTLVLQRDKKPALLTRLAKKHQARWQNSIAVGDSESDILMLEAVELPIAFNPTQKLYQHAKQAGWPILLERKNVVYKLNFNGSVYQLGE